MKPNPRTKEDLDEILSALAEACKTTPEALRFAMECLKVAGLSPLEGFAVLEKMALKRGYEIRLGGLDMKERTGKVDYDELVALKERQRPPLTLQYVINYAIQRLLRDAKDPQLALKLGIRSMARADLPIISLFSGALGLDLGLEQAGFRIAVAVECNKFAADTIRQNRPDIVLLEKRLEELSTKEILAAAGLKPGEPALITGGPSCQAFSTAGQRGSMSDPRGILFREFLRVVREARPRFFVMENVKGILSAAIRHRPLGKRGPGHRSLDADERLGSALSQVLKELKKTGYYVVFDLLNTADFGVPQTRERVAFVGSRDGEPIWMPEPTHARAPASGLKPWVTLRKAAGRLATKEHDFTPLAPSKARFLRLVPEGGNWKDLPADMQSEALGAAFVSWGGRSGFCRRLAWDRPSPALTTRPDSKATMLCHPTETRPLSIEEYSAIQQFPRRWKLGGGTPQKYKQLGNAVPLGLGKALGLAIRKAMRSRKPRLVPLGAVVCADQALLKRLAGRPQTVLNPTRMRRVKAYSAARKWLAGEKRLDLLKLAGATKERAVAPRRKLGT